MKKILVLVCFVVALAACATQPPGNKDTMTNANKGGEMKSTAAPSEADIIAKEKAGWDAIKKKDWDALGKILASDFTDVEDDGVYNKTDSIASLKDYDLSDITYSDWKMLTIDKDAVLLTYNLNPKATYKGQAVPPGPYHAAAAYVNRDGEWLGIYFQQTLAQAMPPPASPTASKSPKSAASPGAKMADAGPDPVANEKLVWDALKSKNYDAFAAYLALDSMEIEADGVFDKSGSVKGVQMFDASKAELSDWKTVKFDNDASLVTYIVKTPGMNPDQARHSTIWASRDGKWLALFHQGTPVAKPEPAK
jgi:hypothetical protein